VHREERERQMVGGGSTLDKSGEKHGVTCGQNTA